MYHPEILSRLQEIVMILSEYDKIFGENVDAIPAQQWDLLVTAWNCIVYGEHPDNRHTSCMWIRIYCKYFLGGRIPKHLLQSLHQPASLNRSLLSDSTNALIVHYVTYTLTGILLLPLWRQLMSLNRNRLQCEISQVNRIHATVLQLSSVLSLLSASLLGKHTMSAEDNSWLSLQEILSLAEVPKLAIERCSKAYFFTEISTVGEVVNMFSFPGYGNQSPEFWGPALWFSLHLIATCIGMHFHESRECQVGKALRDFLLSGFQKFIPCEKCALNWIEIAHSFLADELYTGCRSLPRVLFELHNLTRSVNKYQWEEYAADARLYKQCIFELRFPGNRHRANNLRSREK